MNIKRKLIKQCLLLLIGLVTAVRPTFAQMWTQTSAPFAGWTSIASSADGTKLVAAAGTAGGVYTSTDSGATWTLTSSPFSGSPDYALPTCVASSADGSKLVEIGRASCR